MPRIRTIRKHYDKRQAEEILALRRLIGENKDTVTEVVETTTSSETSNTVISGSIYDEFIKFLLTGVRDENEQLVNYDENFMVVKIDEGVL